MGGLLVLGALAAWGACAQGTTEFPADDGSAGGDGGAGGSDGGLGGSAGASPCGIDCSDVQPPDACHVSVCNEDSGVCEIVPGNDGATCEDGFFCTVDDTCMAGTCVGGPANTCGLTAEACNLVGCDEQTDACIQTPLVNGTSCVSDNLCLLGSTCQNGLCVGGTLDDCFFEPTPACHTSTCNPATGDCEAMPDASLDGSACPPDPLDPCTINRTCLAGACQGGVPKDCSGLTSGCNLGICDTATGNCVAQPVMAGDPCDDLNNCTVGETCNAGMCNGGMPISACVGGDFCCPSGCTEATDSDCSCSVNLALSATPSSSGGGVDASGYGPANFNNGVDEIDCQTTLFCNQCQGWISNDTVTLGDWVQYEWSAPVTIGSMYVDANNCPGSTCYDGRTFGSGTIQYWDGVAWQNAHTFTNNNGDLAVTFASPINTTRLRVMDLRASACGGQQDNTLIYEWYVWPGTGCTP
jgi:hypothetical protein